MATTTAAVNIRDAVENASTATVSTSGAGEQMRENPLVVLKVGTSSLMLSSGAGFRVNLANLARLVDTIARLKREGYQVVLVSSGAVGMGCIKLGLTSRPTSVQTKQAVAAAGQSHLLRLYEDLFGALKMQVAQLLINQSDFLDKDHWQSVQSTIHECLALGVVPIINENDSTNTAEMRFGDNDNLAALTAVQLEADALFLCTDVDFLYTANPRSDPNAKALKIVDEPWALQVDTADEGSGMGTGGMATKILAARTASTAGIPCGLINGQHTDRVFSFLKSGMTSSQQEAASVASDRSPASVGADEEPHGTLFMPMSQDGSICHTRRWILSLPASAQVSVNDACARQLAGRGSLLPKGISKVHGKFEKNDCVKLMHNGTEIGRGLVNFDSDDLQKIQGKSSNSLKKVLGLDEVPLEACDEGNVVLTVAADAFNPNRETAAH
eukprot:CAMPEP_0206595146 /NCGR_PEP_ID=MMETSP0325_2-20121206/42834_1 /ASSEMBLY_ACC=CAM_ASM_000347 /TAXON_ID=2866 /ORGANISM="Crypthecodinium cohnii, Strain Seligo" /LENGTH=440 /DNA_ID=CAMNT_0054105819 /DNA_START=50 /DNA_END=1372 /DNA_ORIENTATION=+